MSVFRSPVQNIPGLTFEQQAAFNAFVREVELYLEPITARITLAADATLTNVTAALTGMTSTFTVHAPDTNLQVIGVFDFNHEAAGGEVAVGECYVDGVLQVGKAILKDTAGSRATVAQTWRAVLQPGKHTILLQAYKTVNAGTVKAMAEHTTFNLARVF